MLRTLKGLGALLLLLALTIGVPAALIMLAGNPIPSGDQLARALTGVDYGGRFLMGHILPLVGWLAWASFALSVLLEIPAALRQIQAPQIRALGPQQALAGALVAAVFAIGPTAPAMATAEDPAPHSVSHSVQTAAPQVDTAKTPAEQKPSSSTQKTADRFVDLHHTVKPGENLSKISQHYLGDADRWPELAEATDDVIQPDGRTLQDPDLIYPGWTVTVPDAKPVAATAKKTDPAPKPTTEQAPTQQKAAPSTAQQAPEKTVTPAAPQASQSIGSEAAASLPGASYSAPASPTSQEMTAQQASAEQADEDPAAAHLDWRTVGGIGSLLAAGVLSVLGLRRTAQRRRRKPGQAVPMPEAQAAEIETQMKAVADPEGADELDQVLKTVAAWAQQNQATLPQMFCVRVSPEQIALYLAEPAELPAPFHPEAEDKTVWTIDSGAIGDLEIVPSAPYPALVTIGQDGTGAQLLVDLEYLGNLGVTGEDTLTSEVLDALAVELSTSTWGEQLQVTLVGVADGLAAACGTGRVRQVADLDELLVMLRGRAEATERALAEMGMESVHQAKASGAEESWMPEIVILGIEPTAEQASELRDLTETIPRLGIAAVTAGDPLQGQWRLSLHDADTADLEPIGLRLVPQKITPQESAQIISVLSTALQDPQTVLTSSEHVSVDEILTAHEPRLSAVPDLDDPAAESAPMQSPTNPVGQEELDTEPELADQDAPEAPEEQGGMSPTLEPAETEASAPTEEPDELVAEEADQKIPAPALSSPEPDSEPVDSAQEEEGIDLQAQAVLDQARSGAGPVISLLGEVRVLGATGQAPISASTGKESATQTARCAALAAFLALNPGATAEQYHAAFWPNAAPEGPKASANRNKLSNLTRKYLGQDEQGQPFFPPVGSEGYRLDERVRTDWQTLQELIGDSPATASTVRLVAAMRMVRGAPFKDVKGKNYAWAEELQQTMIETICDAAHELVTRSLRSGHHNHAQMAAHVGRVVDPANEAMWRNALMAEAAAGQREAVARLVENLYAYLESFEEGFEPEEETSELIDQLRDRGYRIAS